MGLVGEGLVETELVSCGGGQCLNAMGGVELHGGYGLRWTMWWLTALHEIGWPQIGWLHRTDCCWWAGWWRISKGKSQHLVVGNENAFAGVKIGADAFAVA